MMGSSAPVRLRQREPGAALCTWLPGRWRAPALLVRPRRHVLAVDQTKRKIGDLDEASRFEGPKQVARRSDMDMNGHINNVTYLAWALETVPQDVYDGHTLFEVRARFLSLARSFPGEEEEHASLTGHPSSCPVVVLACCAAD